MAQETLEEIKARLAAKREEKKNEVKETMERNRVEVQLGLLDNPSYVKSQILRENKAENIKTLDEMIIGLNDIADEQRGAEPVKVVCFPMGQSFFGQEIAKLIGILNTVKGTYLEEHVVQATTIAKVSTSDVEDFFIAFGQASYYSKRDHSVSDEVAGDTEQAATLLSEIAENMGLKPLNMKAFNDASHLRFMTNEKIKAERKLTDIQTAMDLEAQANEDGKGRLTINS